VRDYDAIKAALKNGKEELNPSEICKIKTNHLG
jgi:hypothetical protein